MRKSFSVNLAAGAIGLLAASAFADVKVNDNLSLSGFADMSLWGNDAGGNDLNATFDQFELDFMFKFSDKLSARVDLAQGGVGGGVGTLALEQGFITYATGAVSVTTGKFLSATGFEAAEPTGMYQYSYNKGVGAYGGYITGAAVSYTASPMISLYGAVVASEYAAATDIDISHPGAEFQISLMPAPGLTIKIADLVEQFDDVAATVGPPATPAIDGFVMNTVNAWASYATGPLLVAGEINYLTNYYAEDVGGASGLALVNFKLNDVAAVTGRFSAIAVDADGIKGLDSEVTLSPSVALASNWFALAELRYDLEPESLSYGLETTITF